jgi:rhodanese-related sulfurtransferase
MSWRSRGATLVALIALQGVALVHADNDPAAVPRVSLADFKKELDAGKVLVIDVRGAETYRAGHIPGALHVPLSAWSEHLPKLKASKKPIVAYCA